MTKTFATNENNDLYVGNDGNLVVATGLTAVQQACLTATKAQLGEMVLQQNLGIPNFQAIWVGVPNIPQFEAALRATILSVDGVTSVENLSVTLANNILKYVAIITTVYGRVSLTDTTNAL